MHPNGSRNKRRAPSAAKEFVWTSARPPTTFGVFKLVGHTVIAFRTQEELQSAMQALSVLDFAASAMVEYSAEEMLQPFSAQHYGRFLIQDLTERALGRM